MALPAAVAGIGQFGNAANAASSPIVLSADTPVEHAVGFERRNFGIVGVFDVDWLTTPGFERLLDNLGDGIDGYRVSELVGSPTVTHAVLVRR